LEKVACGAFSDIGFVSGGKRRDFCRLRGVSSADLTAAMTPEYRRPFARAASGRRSGCNGCAAAICFKSRAGILIPATADVSRRLVWAEVIAVGPTVRSVEQGDAVLFSPESGFEVEIHGDEYLILRERDVHAVASPRSDGGSGLYL